MLLKGSLLLLVAVASASATSCEKYFQDNCDNAKPSTLKFSTCTPEYGAVKVRSPQLHRYIKQHLSNSIEYLLKWANFNSFDQDRQGFAKMYKKLSDETWDDAIDLVKYLGKRGVEFQYNAFPTESFASPSSDSSLERSEITSLAKVLDLHKQLAIAGNVIHEAAVKHDGHDKVNNTVVNQHDYELANFLKEKFAEKHAEKVRELAGHSTDLRNLLKEFTQKPEDKSTKDIGFAIHMFDEYLKKLY